MHKILILSDVMRTLQVWPRAHPDRNAAKAKRKRIFRRPSLRAPTVLKPLRVEEIIRHTGGTRSVIQTNALALSLIRKAVQTDMALKFRSTEVLFNDFVPQRCAYQSHGRTDCDIGYRGSTISNSVATHSSLTHHSLTHHSSSPLIHSLTISHT